ncbi:MAG: DUF3788 domain-containing protein [Ruminococcaceae bacterium]|nr:DUF3788 domain-containing protein [Oscillospiraceae bacterium]
MQWSELYGKEQEPTADQIKAFVDTPLWDDLADSLQRAHKVEPKLFYSACSMEKGYWKGWNVKYKKSGRALCTLYPKQGYFVALVPVCAREAAEADLLMPLCDAYTQKVYSQTRAGATGKSLAIEVTSGSILQDIKQLAALRAAKR